MTRKEKDDPMNKDLDINLIWRGKAMDRSLEHFRQGVHKTVFTLIELLVVVAIIAVLVALLLPGLQRAREGARKVKCGVQVHQIGLGLSMYAGDNTGRYPLRIGWDGTPNTADQYYIQIKHWASRRSDRPEGTGFIVKYLRDYNLVYCPNSPMSAWISEGYAGAVVEGSWASTWIPYVVFSGSGHMWKTYYPNDPLASLIADDSLASPETFILTDQVIQRPRYPNDVAMVSNHPARSHIVPPTCIGGNVLYNDLSVPWKNIEELDGYTIVFNDPEGPGGWFYPTRH
jgi:prepilin-type N-terminal cleavage/methylation domain-containing protein